MAQISRRGFLAGIAAAMAGGCAGRKTLSGRMMVKRSRPNVLLITADDMNYDSPGVTGCPVPDVTPHIDRLASEGVRFVHAHVTSAVCQPSRETLMTGRYPHRHGGMGFEPIRPDVPTLQEQLDAAGYMNGILAKVGHLAPEEKFHWTTVVGARELGAGRDPGRYYEEAKAFFEGAKQTGKPFFLMANSQDPHRPFAGSEEDARRFEGRSPVSRTYAPEEVVVPEFLPDLPDVRRELAQYFTSVHRCDETVGGLLRALGESGLEEDTLVMFLSDNGMSFPYAKTNCYPMSTRTPWIVRWPGVVKPGTVDDAHFISGIDFMPTVLEAAGLPLIEGMDGRSFVPLLRGEDREGRESVYTVFSVTSARNPYPMRAIQDRRFAYIFNAWSDGKTVFKNEGQAGLTMKAMRAAAESDPAIAARVEFFLYRVPEEFYVVDSDPNALANRIADPEYRGEIDAMRRRMLDTMIRTQDPLLGEFRTKALGMM